MREFLHSTRAKIKTHWATLGKYQMPILVISGLFSALFLFLLVMIILCNTGAFGSLPGKKEIAVISNPLSSKIYCSESKLIGRYYIENRDYFSKEDINTHFKNALVAAEDHRFYSHSGVDYLSLGRVFVKSILLRKDASGGGSTITQQLVKNLYPRKEYRLFSLFINKLREMAIARRIEKVYDKDEIIQLYASTVSFGEQAFGLATASERFFNKKPNELLPEEASLLVGILKATSYYNPRRHPERAIERRNLVLFQMRKHGYLDDHSLEVLKKMELKLDYQVPEMRAESFGHFKQYVKKAFAEISDTLRKDDGTPYNLYYDGLKIYTSLDRSLQLQAEKARDKHMKELQRRFDSEWKGGPKFGKSNSILDDHIRNHPEYKYWKDRTSSIEELIDSFNIESQQKYWTWEGQIEKKSTRIDSIKHYLSLLHASLFAADLQSGAVRVWVGGNDYSRFQFDNVMARRQVGSLFKPIVYLSALENGIKPCDYYKNELISYDKYEGWTPGNADESYGGYSAVHNALARSLNSVSVQILFDTPMNEILNLAQKLGIEASLDPVPSLVLGTSDISLIEMARAYARICTGVSTEFYCIERIEDREGNTIYKRTDAEFEMLDIDPEARSYLKAMLGNVVRNGTAQRLYSAYEIPSLVLGKTGTTQNQSDGWFLGCTSDLVAGSWVGTEDRRMHFRKLSTGAGSQTAMPMAGRLFEIYYDGSRTYNASLQTQYFECLPELDDEQYAYHERQERMDSIMAGSANYGGWLKKIFGKKPDRMRLNDRYNQRQIEKQLEELRKKRLESIRAYDQEIRMWEQKLQQLDSDDRN